MRLRKADNRFPPPFTGERLATAYRRVRRTGGGLLAAFLLIAPAAAGWREDATARDMQRLEQLAEAKAKGLMEAGNATPSDLAAIRSILQAGVTPASPTNVTGNWRCRMMKLGGLTPAIVYSWFKCRITAKGGRLFFEKLTGSQRTSGYLYPEGGSFVYLGAQYVGTGYGPTEKRPAYSGTGAAAGAVDTPDDQIGLLSLTTSGRARIEFPYPVQESVFDVLELKR